MSQVEISEAQSNLPGLIERACNGEDVTSTSNGRALVRLLPLARQPVAERAPRRLGVAEGKIRIPGDLDAALPDDLLDLFYNGPLFPKDPNTAGTSHLGHDDGADETRDEP